MVEVKINREAKKEEDGTITIKTELNETNMTHEEFSGAVTHAGQLISGLENEIEASKEKLKELKDVEETEELKKFNEMLKLSKKLEEKQATIDSLKKSEKTLQTKKEETQTMFDLMAKLNAEKNAEKKV